VSKEKIIIKGIIICLCIGLFASHSFAQYKYHQGLKRSEELTGSYDPFSTDESTFGKKNVPAQGNAGFKRLEWHARAQGTYIYDDNIFLGAGKTFANGTSESKVEDSIFIISPSLQLTRNRLKGEVFGLDLNYRVNKYYFLETTSENSLEHDGRISLVFSDGGEHLKLTLRGRYFDTVDPSTTEFASNLRVRAARTDIFGTSELEWNISNRLRAIAFGGFRSNLYDHPFFQGESFEQIDGGLKLTFKATPLTSFGLKYNYRKIQYSAGNTINRDSDTHSYLAVVYWRPTAIISGDLAVGYDSRVYQGAGSGDRSAIRYETHLKYTLNNRTNFFLTGKRSIEDSTFSTIDAYVRTYGALAWNQTWSSRFSSTATLRYTNRDYNTAVADIIDGGGAIKARNDNEYSADAKILYHFHRLYKAGIRYEYRDNQSNFNVFDYTGNKFTAFISAGF
jgi:hypothetical protein